MGTAAVEAVWRIESARIVAALSRFTADFALAEDAAAHASAPSVEATDWARIVVLYEALGRVAPPPVVELNRAVAVAWPRVGVRAGGRPPRRRRAAPRRQSARLTGLPACEPRPAQSCRSSASCQ